MYFQCGRKASKTKHNKHTPRCTCTASNALPSSFLMHEGVVLRPGTLHLFFHRGGWGCEVIGGLQIRNCSLKRSVIRREIKFKSYQFDISWGTCENPLGERFQSVPECRNRSFVFVFGKDSPTEKE